MQLKHVDKRRFIEKHDCPLCRMIGFTTASLHFHLDVDHRAMTKRLGEIVWVGKDSAIYNGRYYKS